MPGVCGHFHGTCDCESERIRKGEASAEFPGHDRWSNRIKTTEAKISKLSDRIGELMSQRVEAEAKLSELWAERMASDRCWKYLNQYYADTCRRMRNHSGPCSSDNERTYQGKNRK